MAERASRPPARSADARSSRRVLQLLGPSTGGIRRHVAALADGLDERGWDVEVAGPPGVMDGLRPARPPGSHRSRSSGRRGGRCGAGPAHPLVRPRPRPRTHRRLAGQPRAAPTAARRHGAQPRPRRSRRSSRRAAAPPRGRLPARADAVIAISDQVARRFTGLKGADRITVIPPVGPARAAARSQRHPSRAAVPRRGAAGRPGRPAPSAEGRGHAARGDGQAPRGRPVLSRRGGRRRTGAGGAGGAVAAGWASMTPCASSATRRRRRPDGGRRRGGHVLDLGELRARRGRGAAARAARWWPLRSGRCRTGHRRCHRPARAAVAIRRRWPMPSATCSTIRRRPRRLGSAGAEHLATKLGPGTLIDRVAAVYRGCWRTDDRARWPPAPPAPVRPVAAGRRPVAGRGRCGTAGQAGAAADPSRRTAPDGSSSSRSRGSPGATSSRCDRPTSCACSTGRPSPR